MHPRSVKAGGVGFGVASPATPYKCHLLLSLSLSLSLATSIFDVCFRPRPHSFIRGIVGGRKCTQFANECKRGDGRLLRRTSCMQSPLSFLVQFAHSRSTRPSVRRASERTNKTENRRTFYLNSGAADGRTDGGSVSGRGALLRDVEALPTNERTRMLL